MKKKLHFLAKHFFRVSAASLLFVMLYPLDTGADNLDKHPGHKKNDPLPDFKNVPVLQWKFQSSQPFLSSPVINENTVYVGGLDSILYAFDLATGMVNWKFRTGGEIRSNVLVDKNQIFLVGGDGTFYSIGKNSGKLNWKWVFNKTAVFLGERKYDLADYFNSSPVLDKEVIYFGSGDGRINAISASNGALLWSYTSGDIIHATPALYNGRVFVASFDGNVYALDSRSGNLLWKFKSVGHEYFPKGEMQGSPVILNGVVYAGSRDYNVYAINAAGGYCNWNQKFPKGWALANSIGDSILYVGTSDDKYIAATDPASGKELWRTDVKFNIMSPCVFSGSMLYVGTLMGKVFGIDRATGAIRWTFTTDGYQINHDKYFKADDSFRDDIYTLIRNNTEYINVQLKWGAVFSSPAISNNALVITGTDGKVYCLVRS
ncbi:MAG: PQQ-binding-like beta-propeller repeat protein [Ferruginibacter sp.]|nr:PQQ-binding-like beta-propeller repeat protein [Chitinophagaceae bacterium]